MHPKRTVPSWYDLAFRSFLSFLFFAAAGTVIYTVLLASECIGRPVPEEIREAYGLSMIALYVALISVRIDSGNMPGREPIPLDADWELLKILIGLAAISFGMGLIMEAH